MSEKENALPVAVVRALLDYEPDTGMFRWRARRTNKIISGAKAGWVRGDGYIAITINRKAFFAHRVAWAHFHGGWPSGQIDHINGNRSDNRVANLRQVSRAENLQNQRVGKSKSGSGLLGVSFEKRANAWKAQIMKNGKTKHIGYFKDELQAHAEYLRVKAQVHPFGEIARETRRPNER